MPRFAPCLVSAALLLAAGCGGSSDGGAPAASPAASAPVSALVGDPAVAALAASDPAAVVKALKAAYTYDYRTLEADLAARRAAVSGALAAELAANEGRLRQGAALLKVVSTEDVLGLGVVARTAASTTWVVAKSTRVTTGQAGFDGAQPVVGRLTTDAQGRPDSLTPFSGPTAVAPTGSRVLDTAADLAGRVLAFADDPQLAAAFPVPLQERLLGALVTTAAGGPRRPGVVTGVGLVAADGASAKVLVCFTEKAAKSTASAALLTLDDQLRVVAVDPLAL